MNTAKARACTEHSDCVRLVLGLDLGVGVVHLGIHEARSLSHQLYYATIDNPLRADADDDGDARSGP